MNTEGYLSGTEGKHTKKISSLMLSVNLHLFSTADMSYLVEQFIIMV